MLYMRTVAWCALFALLVLVVEGFRLVFLTIYDILDFRFSGLAHDLAGVGRDVREEYGWLIDGAKEILAERERIVIP